MKGGRGWEVRGGEAKGWKGRGWEMEGGRGGGKREREVPPVITVPPDLGVLE